MIKKILIALLLVFVIIQFIRPEKNESSELSPNDITQVHNVPEGVKSIMAKACNDCHSNNTQYPWYNSIQPVAWYLEEHVEDGKRHFNFSEFGSYEPWRAYHKLEELIEEVEEGKMPMDEYTWMHKEAVLTEAEKGELIDWAKGIRAEMKADTTLDLQRPPRPAK
ncbi:heme-binding domain-containing protein [Marinilongibacter aquaticus]|uniref:heme-binding domain-containing protein n=1 Tax=Marinilongibacter aquaticus TaxID=2975157 RepID=UPI0021BD1213|nr:heme-binding domain-containing protein [Marinilongibacter aquaticus]UBM60876.1 heme-binding domain-containing protein [Marinilongibacter aquaticus]